MNLRNFIPIILFSFISTWSCAKTNLPQADTTKPEVGKPMPDFTLNNLTHYKSKKASLNDFKGKWLYLDFWFTGCTACIKSFSKVNSFQKEFKDQLNWVLVGINNFSYDKDSKAIENLYEKLCVKQGLQMASAYDSVLYKRWEISSMPHIYVIDPNGTLRFISDGRDMTKEKIRELLNEKTVSFYPKDIERLRFDSNTYNNRQSNSPQNKLLYRSIITEWNGEKQDGGYEIDRYVKIPAIEWKKGYQLAMVPLHWLYNTAYFGKCYLKDPRDSLYGKVYPFPVLELRDTSLFEFDYAIDVGKGLYNYNLLVPASQVTKENIMMFMQQDLVRTFKYRASIETREMPVWKLIAKPGVEKKIKTKGDKSYNSENEGSTAAGFTVRNVPVETFLTTLSYYLGERTKDPFIDGTYITSNIDMNFNADLTNFEDIKKALQKSGLDLIKGLKKMKVLVIRDF